MKRRQANRNAGFTLLEVLVATAILGTAVAALFSLLSGALSNARRLQGPEQAVLLARSQLNELLAASEQGRGPALPLDQSVQGRWASHANDLGAGQFRWEAVARRVVPEAEALPGQPILVRILFDVFWTPDAERQERQMTFETYQLWQQPQRGAP